MISPTKNNYYLVMNIIYKHISFSVTSLHTEQLFILREATIVELTIR